MVISHIHSICWRLKLAFYEHQQSGTRNASFETVGVGLESVYGSEMGL
jgi:hypothetical protein